MSDKERELHLQNLYNDIVRIVAEQCVHPESKRCFSIDDIRDAVKEVQLTVKPDKPAKA